MKKISNNIKCVIYARLSNEDQYELKSVSIETQISICSEYAKNNNLIVKEILYDDGYSGTNFNRPSFQKLIELIETKTINCLIIKDLSRLGRNFLKVSEFVEDYFPKKNIRLISINDNYDSENTNDEELTVAIRNFLNGYYAKECTKKFNIALINKSKRKQINSRGMYGYKIIRDQQTKETKMKIDKDSALIVKRIFKMFINGISTPQIAKTLEKEKILSPIYTIYLNNKWKIPDTIEEQKYKWTKNIILKIIKNKSYLGHTINFRRSNKENVIIENTHEAIISEEIFNQAQSIIIKRSKPNDYCNVRLYKLLYDEDNKLLTFNNSKKHSVYTSSNKKIYINSEALHEILFKECVQYINIYKQNNQEFIDKYINLIESDYNENEYKKLLYKQNRLEKKIQVLFEQYVMNEISEINYELELEICKQGLELINEEINKLSLKKLKVEKIKETFNKFLNDINNITLESDKLKIIYTIIKKVVVKNIVNFKYKVNIEYKYCL